MPRAPDDIEINAPEFPPGLEWLNVASLRMDELRGQSAVLIEFWDSARVNSLRTMPYLKSWHERYAGAGLRVVGVHTPGYSFGRDSNTVARAVERLQIDYPVVLDPDFIVWRTFGNRGWPGLYLFDRRGELRWYHYGEGAYRDTELAIREVLLEIDDSVSFPALLEPLRPEDAPGVLLEPQTADIALPKERERVELIRDWTDGEDYIEAADAGAAATVAFTGATAYAVLSGPVEPGVYEAPDGELVAEDPGLRLHGFQFTPKPPAES